MDYEEKYIDLVNKHIVDEYDKIENSNIHDVVQIPLDKETNNENQNNDKAVVSNNQSVDNTISAKQCNQENSVNHKHLELNKIKVI